MIADGGGSGRRSYLVLWLINAASLVVAIVAALGDPGRPPVVPGFLIMSLLAFSWQSLAWRGGARPQLTRDLTLIWLAIWVISFVGYAAFGSSLLTSARLSSGQLLQGILAAACYQYFRALWRRHVDTPKDAVPSHDWRDDWRREWQLTRPLDLAALAVAAVVSVVVITPIGSVPEVWWGAVGWYHLGIWWALSTVNVFVGGACVLILFPGYSREELRAVRLRVLVPLVAVSVLSLILVFHRNPLPTTWVLLIPSIWAGLTLRPWGAAAHTLLLALATSIMGANAAFGDVYGNRLRIELEIDLLLDVCALVALTLALQQQQLRTKRTDAREQAAFLETVLEEMQDGVVVLGQDRRVIYHNGVAEALLGPGLAGLPDGTCCERLQAHSWDGTPATDDDVLDSRHSATQSRTLLLGGPIRSEPEVQIVAITTVPVPRRGESRQLLVARDVRAQIEREESMRSFAAVAAHDLKGPLSALSGWVEVAGELLAEGNETDAVTALDKAGMSGHRMRATIDGWLSHSVLGEGRIDPEPVDLADLITSLAAPLSPPRENGHAPAIEVAVTHQVYADPMLTRQLLTNLISNALKYTALGVPARIRITSEADGDDFIRVDVTDRGLGLTPGEEERIFEAFQRGTGVWESYEGSGVGLSVCRTIADRHGGRIWAVRNLDQGSTFSVTLPAGPPAADPT